MKFSTPLIFSALSAFAAATPTPETNSTMDGTLVPESSIIGGLNIPNDVYPVFTYENSTATVVFLNSTILAEAKASNADVSDNSLARRDAEADASFHWVSLKIGQPFFKRDAEADAGFHWVSLKIGQPFFKRDAEANADAGFHWVTLKIGQPFF